MTSDKLLLTAYCLLLTFIMTVAAGCGTEKKNEDQESNIENQGSGIENRGSRIENKDIERLKEALKKDPTLWRERHKLGVTYMTNGRYQEAVEEFTGVLAVKHDSVEAMQSLGMAYYRMGKNHLAVSYWRSALEIQPENKLIWRLVRQLESETPDLAETKKLDHRGLSQITDPPLIPPFGKGGAAETVPMSDEDLAKWTRHYKKGQDYYANNDYSKAIEEFEMAAKYNPSDYRTYFSMGAVYNAKGDMDKAIASWRKALKLKPDDLMIMKLVTLAKTRRERETEFKKAEELVKKEPDNWKTHERLAVLYADTKNEDTLDKAADEYREVIRLYSEYTPAYLKLAEISFAKDRYDDGLEYLTGALKLQPESEKIKRQIETMRSYNRLYQTGREEWKEGGIERYKEMVLVEEGPSPFYIDKYEVINAQYKEFLDNNPQYRLPHHWKSGTYRKGRDNYPVVNVDWYMANVYCKAMEKRLPTEEEWEKAARGKEGNIYPWGTDFDKNLANSMESEFEDLTPVGVFKEGKSPYGVYDMAGNAEEWTISEHKAEESGDNGSQFPKTYKVRRGGSFRSDSTALILTNRAVALPTDTDKDVGFRCVKDGH